MVTVYDEHIMLICAESQRYSRELVEFVNHHAETAGLLLGLPLMFVVVNLLAVVIMITNSIHIMRMTDDQY